MKLMILDGNSIMNRAYFGIKMLSSQNGIYTNAIIGFLNIMEKMKREEKPDALCVTFDVHAPTFRHQKYDFYKATRHPMPEELCMQMPYMEKILRAMNVPVYAVEGWEADDVLGTVGRICGEQGWSCVIVTGDRDSLQLISKHTAVKLIISKPGSTTATLYDRDVFFEEYGFEPVHLIDLKALMGDSSDNIPGVSGVGKKTASTLIQTYATIDNVYAHLDEQKESLRRKLETGRESAGISYELAQIHTDAPIDFSPEANLLTEPDEPALYELFRELQCFKLIEQYRLSPVTVKKTAQAASECSLRRLEAFPCISAGSDECGQLSLEQTASAEQPIAIMLSDEKLFAATEEGFYCGEIDSDYLTEAAMSRVILCCDYKALARELLSRGCSLPGRVFDLSLAGYVLDPSAASFELKKLSERYLSETQEDEDGAKMSAMLRLYPVLSELIEEQELHRVYYEIDLPLCPVLAEMELTGVSVDREQLDRFSVLLSVRIAELEETVFSYAGERFNINSTKKLAEILFEKLQLPSGKKTKSGYSTNAEVLEKLRPVHPIVDAILEYRQLTKLQSTYAVGLMNEIQPDGRIRTTFQNMITATGRLSSTDPNLQNIPVRTELGAEIRKMFVPAPGCVFVDADYSQIELRVLADISGDTAMQQAFISGEDFHSATAAAVFGIPVSEVSQQQRRSAKAINFGIVYGISKWSLSKDLGIDPWEAEDYMNTYFARFPKVRQYMDSVVADAHADGYTRTLFGRRRYLPELKSSNFIVRSAAERMALNSPVQGTAADIIKLAMLRVSKALSLRYPRARLVLQVHDELIVECPEADAPGVSLLVAREMQESASLSVPLTAEAHSGKTWFEAK